MSTSEETCGPIRPPEQERINAATHWIGLVLSLIGGVVLFVDGGEMPLGLSIACGVYVTSLIAVYTVSALSHAVQQPARKHTLRVWDQGLIYLLIAGTYTPLIWAYLPAGLRWWGLAFVWVAAIAGKLMKVVAQHRVSNFSTQTYLWLGWFPALFLLPFASLASSVWMVLGGLSYTAGTVFLMNDQRYCHFHAIWHLFVILGSACHFGAIYAAVVSH